jgi:hypothetical protein
MILICDISYVIAISSIQESLFIPKNYLIWTFDAPGKYLVFVIIILIDILAYLLWMRLLKRAVYWNPFQKKYLNIIVIFTILSSYIQITSVSVFTDKEIINHSFYHPNAQVYTYKDIHSVQTGIYGNRIPFIRDNGDIYYIITFKDGTKINLMDMGGETSDDTYSQVEHMDKIIMSYGVKKISSEKNIQFVQMDKIYVDRFKRIIENK